MKKLKPKVGEKYLVVNFVVHDSFFPYSCSGASALPQVV